MYYQIYNTSQKSVEHDMSTIFAIIKEATAITNGTM